MTDLLGEWTQADIARRMGVTQSAVSQWLGGQREPSFANARRLARMLDITVDDLFAAIARERRNRERRKARKKRRTQ